MTLSKFIKIDFPWIAQQEQNTETLQQLIQRLDNLTQLLLTHRKETMVAFSELVQKQGEAATAVISLQNQIASELGEVKTILQAASEGTVTQQQLQDAIANQDKLIADLGTASQAVANFSLGLQSSEPVEPPTDGSTPVPVDPTPVDSDDDTEVPVDVSEPVDLPSSGGGISIPSVDVV